MKFFQFFASRSFWANLVLIAVFLILLMWGLRSWLSSYTRHGDSIQVPDLSRLAYAEARESLEELQLNAVIMDTSEFFPEYPRGSVIKQYPEAGNKVKVGRDIRLTLNPMKPRKIELPQLIEKTKRRAIYDLNSKGFEVGELSYVPYIGKDVVVDVKVDGSSAEAGQRFDKGTVVDLVLGEGLGGRRIPVPYLRYMTLEEAENRLLDASLNRGSVNYDEEVTDSAAAVVYRQYPEPSLKPRINLGYEVDLWLTNDYTKVPNDSLKFRHPHRLDSLQHDTTRQIP